MNIIEKTSKRFLQPTDESMSVQEYLELCKRDPQAYDSPHQRMLRAIGGADLVDTSKDARLARLFSNATIRTYPVFSNFYGTEESIQNLVSYFVHAAQGLEEKKNILYLLGPVGGGKSSTADTLKILFESQPFYMIEGSPVNDSPLSLFNTPELKEALEKQYGIPEHRVRVSPSPWLVKRLEELNGDVSKLRVIKVFPNISKQLGMAVVEAGDAANQDVSVLVGKTNIRKVGTFDQNDPDCYNYSGGLCRANQGLMEYREMFKAGIDILNPLLYATQDGIYNGTEQIGGMPFEGIILAHSNETEWELFKNDRANEALLDRICLVRVPYTLRKSEEIMILDKLLRNSNIKDAPCAPQTKDILASMTVMSRLTLTKDGSTESMASKLKIYDGQSLKNKDPKALPLETYKREAGLDEGMAGLSTRFAFKVLSKTFNFDTEETAADPIHLMFVLENAIKEERFSKDKEDLLLNFLNDYLNPSYREYISKQIQAAYIEFGDEYGQNRMDRYVAECEAYIADQDYRDPDTHSIIDRDELNRRLEKIEKPAGISNPKDFRNEVVMFCLRVRERTGHNPKWTEYDKLREAIEKQLFINIEEMLPVISNDKRKSKDEDKKYNIFMQNMRSIGYTDRQIRRLVNFFVTERKK